MYKFPLCAALVSACLVVLLLPVSVNAVSWPATSEQIELVDRIAVPSLPDSNCRYSYQQFYIDGQDDAKSVCINQSSGNIVIGSYLEKGRYYYVAGSAAEDTLYLLKGCSGANTCLYLPSQDVLFIKQHLVNSIVYGLTAYENISEKLRLSYDTLLNKKTYSIDAEQPDYIFQDQQGYAWPVVGWAASSNERWLAFELRERGYAIMDVASMSVKRISNQGIRYGQGMNPRVELAVNDQGSAVVVTGANAGARIIIGTDNCGDSSTDQEISANSKLHAPCIEVPLQINRWVNDFLYGYLPKFDMTGSRLVMYIASKNGELSQIILQPQGQMQESITQLSMGDSYSSGEGEAVDSYYLPGTNQEYSKCHVSSRSYPFLVGELLLFDKERVKNIACSGARIDDITGSEVDYWGQGGRLAESGLDLYIPERMSVQQQALINFMPGMVHQEKFVQLYRPEIVTVGIGGNDAGLFDKLKTCLMPGTCEWVESQDRIYQTGKEIDLLETRLRSVYNRLQEASPTSRLYIIGYPQVITDADSCGLLGELLNYSERRFVIQSITKLNDVIRRAAVGAGVKYVDTSTVFDGHRLCEDDAAVNSMRTGDDITPISSLNWLKLFGNESFHPTPFGQKLLAERVSSAISGSEERATASVDAEYWRSDGDDDPGRLRNISMLSSTTLSFGSEVVLKLSSGTLLPNSEFSVSLHSDPIHLLSSRAQPDGSATVTVPISDAVQEGFHTVHITGLSYTGAAVDLYQAVGVFSYTETKASAEQDEQEVTDSPNPVTVRSDITENRLPQPSKNFTNHRLITGSNDTTKGIIGYLRSPDAQKNDGAVLANHINHQAYDSESSYVQRTLPDYIVGLAMLVAGSVIILIIIRLLLW